MNSSAEIHTELERAKTARAAGNEGRARTWAPRATRIVSRVFVDLVDVRLFESTEGETRIGSSFEALQTPATFPGPAPVLKQAAVHLTLLVSRGFILPTGIDIIDETH